MKYIISIIVPYRNAAEYLDRCCRSLHALEGNFEFVMVDDNHSPETLSQDEAVIVKYAEFDNRFHLYMNNLTPGVSGARNAGIDYALGEWITFLDADDEILPEAKRAYRKVLKADANVHQINHKRYYPRKDRFSIKYRNLSGWYDIEHLPEAWYGVWNKLFRAEFLREYDIRFKEGLQYGEDGLFVLECLAADNRIHHADVDLFAVQHNFYNRESLSHVKTQEDVIEQIHEYEKFMLAQEDPKFKRAVCDEIGLLWSVRMKKFYKEYTGGAVVSP